MNYDFSSHQHQRHENFDPYDVMDVPRDADMETVRQAFRKLTRVYHPDRNRNNPNYKAAFYSRICAAYEILCDPRQRAAFDQQHATSWNVLRDSSRSFATPASTAASAPTTGKFGQRARFSESDLGQFNAAFDKQRKASAHDRGYGDQMMGRITEQEIKRGRQPVDAPTNLFSGSSNVNSAAFNSRFESELRPKRQQGAAAQSKSIMERSSEEPLGWAVGGGGSASFSDISVYDGIMVDREREDFSKVDEATGLNYSDYMSGFNTFTEQLPEQHHYFDSDKRDVERVYNERLAQLNETPERGHNMSFSQAEVALNKRREQDIFAEQQRNREMVLKYRNQYSSDDLLPAPSSSRKEASVLQVNARSKRDGDASINDRINDRQFDNRSWRSF